MTEVNVVETGWRVRREWFDYVIYYPPRSGPAFVTTMPMFPNREAAVAEATRLEASSWVHWRTDLVRHVRIEVDVDGQKLSFPHEYVERYHQ
jgi:hypothetical protein